MTSSTVGAVSPSAITTKYTWPASSSFAVTSSFSGFVSTLGYPVANFGAVTSRVANVSLTTVVCLFRRSTPSTVALSSATRYTSYAVSLVRAAEAVVMLTTAPPAATSWVPAVTLPPPPGPVPAITSATVGCDRALPSVNCALYV